MVTMQRGFKSKLEAGGVDVGLPIQVLTSIVGNSHYDFSCFSLDHSDKVPNDGYVVFFNQPNSLNDEISLEANSPKDSSFQVNLVSLPSQIQKLCFTVTIDGQGSMRDINTCTVQLMQNGQIAFSLEITGRDFQSQKAIITVEIYNKNGWRVAAVANGFNFSGGLDALMAYYGINVSDDSKPTSPSPRPMIRQEKPSHAPVRNVGPESPQQQSVMDTKPASGKNTEGFNRTDNDWV
jgi:stress response protein SCP2